MGEALLERTAMLRQVLPGNQEGTAMPELMPAVICHGPHDYRLEEAPVPRPGPGSALVKVEAVGILRQ